MGTIHSSEEEEWYAVGHPKSVRDHAFDASHVTEQSFRVQYELEGASVSNKACPGGKPVDAWATHSLELGESDVLGTGITLRVRQNCHQMVLHLCAADLDVLAEFSKSGPDDGSKTTTLLTRVVACTSAHAGWGPLPSLAVVTGSDPGLLGLRMPADGPNLGIVHVLGADATLWVPLVPLQEAAETVWGLNWPALAAGLRVGDPRALEQVLWPLMKHGSMCMQLGMQLGDLLKLLCLGGRSQEAALATAVAAMRVHTLGGALIAEDVLTRCLLTTPLSPPAAAALQGLLLQACTGEIRVPDEQSEFVPGAAWCSRFGVPAPTPAGGAGAGTSGPGALSGDVFPWCSRDLEDDPRPRDGFGCVPEDYITTAEYCLDLELKFPVGVSELTPCQQALALISQQPSFLGTVTDDAAAAMAANPAALLAAKADLLQQLRTWAAMVTVDFGAALFAPLPVAFKSGRTKVTTKAAELPAYMHGPLSTFLLAAVPGHRWNDGGIYGDGTRAWIDSQASALPHDEVVRALVDFAADDGIADKSDAAASEVVKACLASVFRASPGKAALAAKLWELVEDMFQVFRDKRAGAFSVKDFDDGFDDFVVDEEGLTA